MTLKAKLKDIPISSSIYGIYFILFFVLCVRKMRLFDFRLVSGIQSMFEHPKWFSSRITVSEGERGGSVCGIGVAFSFENLRKLKKIF